MSVMRPALLTLAVVLAAPAAFASKADAKEGEKLFTSKACATCHAVSKATEAGKIGPSLVGVVGRKAGTTKALMPTSPALAKSGITWNSKTLDEFLANPTAKVPGTAMAISIPDPEERADVIAYLATLKN
jgi:cytochrome c2